MALIVKKGDFSDHQYNGVNGYIITVTTTVSSVEGQMITRVSDLHYCPIPGHGITPIVNGSGNVKDESKIVACAGSKAGCGASILPSSLVSNVPLESPSGAGKLNGPLVLGGPDIAQDNTMIMG
jgi:uncharacterized Zn-binding protein involved in type VI secretion